MISFEVLIAVTTLIWVIHTFIFSLIQSLKTDLLRRIQFAVSTTKDVRPDTSSLFTKGWLSEFDIYELGASTENEETREEVTRYARTQIQLKRLRSRLIINLFLFTALAAYLVFATSGANVGFFFKLYFFFTLGLVFVSYFQIEEMRNVKFTAEKPPIDEPPSDV